jgi:proteasome accessory factor C
MSSRLTARETLDRALAIVPWIAAQGGTASVEEVCRRFDLDVEQLSSCLETVSMVGVYPYTPDALIEAFIEPDHVYVNLPDYFRRPLRLTPTQTFGLVAAGRALLSVPGADNDGPLARALAKIMSMAGSDSAIEIDIDTAPPEVLIEVQQAIAAHRQIEIEYYTFARDAWSTRVIDPWRVQALDGNWYLDSHCTLAGAQRVFRLDRIRGITILDTTFAPPGELPPLEVFPGDSKLPRITLDLTPAAAWVATQYPVEASERLPDGHTRVTLAVSAGAWLERLLLRLGDGATVVEADPSLVSARTDAARRVLARYLH